MTSGQKKWKRGLDFWLFVGPVFLVFAVIVLVPFFNGVMYSFTDWNGVTGELNWIGFDNYVRLFTSDEQFQQSFWLTTKYTVVAVVLTNVVGFILAFLLTQRRCPNRVLGYRHRFNLARWRLHHGHLYRGSTKRSSRAD